MEKRTQFILWLTHYFNGHWEDPEWGKSEVGQLTLKLAMYEMAGKINDAALARQLQGPLRAAVHGDAQNAVRAA
jgi:hypothetical protein